MVQLGDIRRKGDHIRFANDLGNLLRGFCQAGLVQVRDRDLEPDPTRVRERRSISLVTGAETGTRCGRWLVVGGGGGEEKQKRTRTGGIALLAWSAGVSAITSLLAHASMFPEETQTVLREYLRAVVLHGTYPFSPFSC